MSSKSRRTLVRGLVVVGTASLSSLLLCAPAWAGDVHLAGLDSAPTHQRFIVKYRQDSPSGRRRRRPAEDPGLRRPRAAGARQASIGVQHMRRLAVGADVVRADAKLDRADAETLMRKLAADPNVEYVEVDRATPSV